MNIMKRILVLVSSAFIAAAARADLVIKQKIESAMINSPIITQIKDNKVRMDISSSPQGATSTILDLNTGDSITLMHDRKTVIKRPGAEARQMAKSMKRTQDNDSAKAKPPQFLDTGKTEKVNGYDTKIYTWTGPEGEIQTVWVAKNFPDYARIKPQMDKLNHSPVAKLSEGALPDVGALPGMVVKTQTEMNGQKVITTLLSAKEETVDASVFDTPKDYQEMTQPGIGARQNR